jgi:phosphoribosylglycinamide formyltransferase-1
VAVESATPSPLRIAVFVGTKGRGSNLMALHAATQTGQLHGHIAVVVGSKAKAPALERARDAGITVAVVDPKLYAGEDTAYADALLTALRRADVDTIALAGYLRRLPSTVVAAFAGRIVNIHPSLLPAFGGVGMYGEHVHRAVLDYGCKISGCTVHLVDETYDTGPIVLQRAVAVHDDDTPATLAARILPHEHTAFIDALQLLAEGRLSIEGRIVSVRPA